MDAFGRARALGHRTGARDHDGAGRDDTTEHATTYFDGDRCVPADTGDRVVITRSENDTLIVKIHDDSFLGTLRRKMSAI